MNYEKGEAERTWIARITAVYDPFRPLAELAEIF